MVDSRDFWDKPADADLDARASRLRLVGGERPREDKRGSAMRSHGYINASDAKRRAPFEVVVCEYENWAMTLISDAPPPIGQEVELQWETEGGTLKRTHGKVVGMRHGTRTRDPFPDLFFSRFEATFL